MKPIDKRIPADTIIFREGDRSDELYIINEGECVVTHGADEMILDYLKGGDIIGEMALLDGSPRSATLKTTATTDVTVVTSSVFKKVLDKLPLWFTRVLRVVTDRLRKTNDKLMNGTIKDYHLSLLCYLSTKYENECATQHKSEIELDYFEIMDEFCFLTKCTRKEFKSTLDSCKENSLFPLSTNSSGAKFIKITHGEIIQLLCEIKVYKKRGMVHPILALDDDELCLVDLLNDRIRQREGSEYIVSRKELEDIFTECAITLENTHLNDISNTGVLKQLGKGSYLVDVKSTNKVVTYINNKIIFHGRDNE